MNEPESLFLTFGGGSRQRGPVTCVGRGLYRLGWTPLFATVEDEDVEVYWGDVIEVEPTADGRHRFVRVVERGPFDHSGYVVGPAFLTSEYFDVFAAALERVLGSADQWMVVGSRAKMEFIRRRRATVPRARTSLPIRGR